MTEVYPEIGFNYRMTDVQAAIGRAQMTRLPSIIEERRWLADRYGELLHGVPGVQPPVEPAWARSNWQSYCVRLPKGADQRAVMQAMLDRKVATRRGIMCAHREPAYEDCATPHTLVQSERAQDECILLPLYPGMTECQQGEVLAALHTALA